MKKILTHLSFYVLLAIVAGVVLGIMAPATAIQLEPLAKGFINIIKAFTYPIIFLTVSLGIASMGSLKKVGRIGFSALVYFEIVSTLSLAIGVIVALIIQPGHINKDGLQMQDPSKYTKSTEFHLWSIIKENTNLQILILAIIVGFVLNFLKKKETYIHFLGQLTHYVFTALKWVMYLAPIGALGGMSYESILLDDLKMYAISRLYLDNFPHVKAYWPMLGRDAAQLTLSYGVNDIDGTIDDTTKIYSMAGSEEQNPAMTTEELVTLIKQANRQPIERGTLYNVIKDYSN